MTIFGITGRVIFVCALFSFSFFSFSCTLKSKGDSSNTLHLVIQEKIKGLDPVFSDDNYTNSQVSQAYETLVGYHYLKRPYSIIPNLAEALPDVSADGLVYTFHLKKGIHFQDDLAFKSTNGKGKELKAEDVVYSFKRLADPKIAASGWWIFDNKIVGLNTWREASIAASRTDYNQPVEGLQAVDPYTLKIMLLRRTPQLLYFLSMPFSSIVPREAVEFYGKQFASHAVGTGPFQLSEFNPNSKIVWVRNPTYRKEVYPSEGEPGDREAGLLDDAGKVIPLADRVVVDVMTEQQSIWLNFLSGKLDVAPIPKDVYSSIVTPGMELSSEMRSKRFRLIKNSEMNVTHATLNMSDPLLGKNKELRQALSMAYDVATYIDIFYNGTAVPAVGPIPPGVFGYNTNFKNPYRRFNLVKAKELLAKAGFPGGKGLPALEYVTLEDSAGRQQAEYFQKMMSAIGVRLKINSYAWPQFLEVIRSKKAQIWETAWIADYPEAENFFQLFYSKNASPGPNDSNYSNPEFDRLYENSLILNDVPEKAELYRKMVALVVEDCPWIFGAHRLSYVVTQPWLKNFKMNDFDHARYKYYRVDVNMKK